MNRVRVVVSGAGGRMGREVLRGVLEDPALHLVGAVDPGHCGIRVGSLAGKPSDIIVKSDLLAVLSSVQADVLLDFSVPEAVLPTARLALPAGVAMVIGTTGLGEADMDELHVLSETHEVPVLVAPNFALGAVLMMQFARQAVRYFPDVEIIEMHHQHKVDAPSGTAKRTAQILAEARNNWHLDIGKDIPIHSVRLPGLVAHQEIIFGGIGQVLSIRHDSIGRESFIPGVVLAAQRIKRAKGVVLGLENLINL